MARSKGLSAQKRLRERKKAERAALKRESRRIARTSERDPDAQVAKREDLEGYGIVEVEDDRDSD